MHRSYLLAAGSALAIPAAVAAQEAAGGAATVALKTADGTDVGSATLRPLSAGVAVEADLSGLPPGVHGLHIHETGACTSDFAAAGGHFAPDGHEHGFGHTATPHADGLPNVIVAADGTAHAEFLNWRLNVEDVLDRDGSALIVHWRTDDYLDAASAGDRIACGVIEQQG